MNGACDICGQVNCNAITLTEDPYRKETVVVNGVIVPEDIVVETSPGAAVKLFAAGTQVSVEVAVAHGIITEKEAAARFADDLPANVAKVSATSTASKLGGKRVAKSVEARPKPQGENRAKKAPAKAPAKS